MNYLEINVNSLAYSRLSKKDKLKTVKLKLDDMFKMKNGKLITVMYKGVKKTIPYDMAGKFKDLCERERALEKVVKVDLDYTDDYSAPEPIITTPVSIKNRPKEVFEPATVVPVSFSDLSLDEKIEVIKQKFVAIFDSVEKYRKNHKKIIKVSHYGEAKLIPYALVSEYKGLKIVLEELERQKRESIKETPVENITEDDDEDLAAVWYPIFEERDKRKRTDNSVPSEESKPIEEPKKSDEEKKSKRGFFAGLLAIPFVKKIVDRLKNRKNRTDNIEDEKSKKKRNYKTSAVALGLAAIVGIGSLLPKFFKRRDNTSGNVKPISTTQEDTTEPTSTITDNIEIVDNNTFDVEPVVEVVEVEEEKEKDSIINFDDKVTIEENSYIYYSSYDAANQTNCLTPLFDGSYERDVMGIVYNLNGNVSAIYSSDPEASNKAQELIDKGATEEAVLVTRSDLVYTGQDEGYYNISDIVVQEDNLKISKTPVKILKK